MIDALVTDGIRRHGRFTGRPVEVNPLDDAGPLLRPLRRSRLKEWIGFVFLQPEIWASMIVQDAKYLATSDVITFAPVSGATRHQTLCRSADVKLPDALAGARAGVTRPGYEVCYGFDGSDGPHRIRIDVAATADQPPVRAELELDGSSTPPPLSVSAPLPSRLSSNAAMFTYKHIFRVAGTLQVGGDSYEFDPARDLAIVDEHRSSLPYRTRWVWGTFASHVDGEVVGANFAHRPKVPGSEEESCLWTPTAAEPLADVDFDHDPADRLGPWRIRSRDRRLDVVFEPSNREEVRQQLGLFAIDYFMMQGRYSGTVIGADRTWAIDGAHGVCERMHARM